MELLKPYIVSIDQEFREEELLKGVFLVIVHATRIPPHIGIIAGKQYHSLTIKGQELNIPVGALVRNNMQRKIPSLFIKIKSHPRFNNEELKELIVANIRQFPKVAVNGATCLSPVKLFFEEMYDIPVEKVNYIFELLPLMEAKGLIEHTSSMFIDSSELQLPLYDLDQLNSDINRATADAAEALKSLKTSIHTAIK